MSETKLFLWGFDDAPVRLRRNLPFSSMNGWLALVSAGSSIELIDVLVAQWRRAGRTVLRYETEDGGIIIVRPQSPDNKDGELM